ncbi:MAG: hypothetical protein ABIJ22_02930 [Patescibacteria group bacterium]
MSKWHTWLKKRKAIWWWVPDTTKLRDKSILEGVMNYGRWQDFLDLEKQWGFKKIKKLFMEMLRARRCNLRPPTKILYSEYLQRHAS